MEINWDPKSLNLFRIQNVLNLKTKDFVFIDDRPDERELVASCHPRPSGHGRHLGPGLEAARPLVEAVAEPGRAGPDETLPGAGA